MLNTKQVIQIINSYSQSRVDYCACVGEREIKNWIGEAQNLIDRQVKQLGQGINPRVKYQLKLELNEAYTALQEQINIANSKLASMEKIMSTKATTLCALS